MIVTFFLGLMAARYVAGMRRERLKAVVDGVLTLPLVLPPTVIGFFLLFIFGANRPVGRFFLDYFSYKIAFSWSATVLAAVVVSFPLMYRAARGALEQVPDELTNAARTLGLPEGRIFWRISMPAALPGIAAGGVLAFARGMGEFGATAMIAGNIAGKTRTLPLAVYSAVAGGDMDEAYAIVMIIVVISFITVAGMNHFLAVEKRRRQRGAPHGR
jgi:molybdate ABC transporter, permease protein